MKIPENSMGELSFFVGLGRWNRGKESRRAVAKRQGKGKPVQMEQRKV